MSEEITQRIEQLIRSEDEVDANLYAEVSEDLEPDQLALLLESLPREARADCWAQVPVEQRVDVLVEMRTEARASLLRDFDSQALDQLISDLDAETLIELAESLPGDVVDIALARMDERQREHYERSAQYAENAIGRYVDHQLLILPQNSRVRDAVRLLRRETPLHTQHLWLVDRTGRYAGAVETHALFGQPDHLSLVELEDEEFEPLQATTSLRDASEAFEHAEVSALPVVDESNRLLGRMTQTLALELLHEHYESKLMASAGLDEEEDLFAPVMRSSRRRATWLGINLLTAFLASWAIGLFEGTLQQVVALAVLMPVVASMGGIAGSQTLTLIIRGLALGQISAANIKPLLRKELSVGGLNGVLWALVIGFVAAYWFSSPGIGLVISLAIVVNIAVAALSGVMVPVLLQRLKIDPALSGSVILTTVTDVVGFVVFLGLGSLFLT
ncbi:magnesium transporter [Marinobacterium zhoushanense]|uniref:Magnesium transporter n=1 Tax=Marinobacterium zhoushanense TaxID=1679163 RepID=A0ABQ1K0Q5_9GAMM|nr:magnesium transporter [Marinobacterium zhoushanense]GGB80362.1 magnesium transporter [Marinobacterium zhoushanense]